jgi:cytochrome P450
VPGLWPPKDGKLSFKQFLDTATYMFNLEIITGLTVADANRSGDEIKHDLDRLIADAQSSRDGAGDTMLGRLLRAVEHIALPANEQIDLVRRILGGTVSGSIAVTFSQCIWAIDRLMDLPAGEIAAIGRIARDGNDALIDRYVREASRFKPFPPGLFRRCDTEQYVERDNPRYKRAVPADNTLVVAMTWSAAFDPEVVPDARTFHVGREDREYLLFGSGQHACPAAQPDRPFAQTLMREMVKALFVLKDLRRARGTAGFIQTDASPGQWPERFILEFTPQAETERSAVAA